MNLMRLAGTILLATIVMPGMAAQVLLADAPDRFTYAKAGDAAVAIEVSWGSPLRNRYCW